MTFPAYTLAELQTLALQRADMVNSDLIGTTEQQHALDNAQEALANILITIQGGRSWSAKKDANYAAGLGDTGLALSMAGLYKLLRVGLYYPRGVTTDRIVWLEPVGGESVRDLAPASWGETLVPRYLFGKDRNIDASAGSPTASSYSYSLVLLPPPSGATWTVRIEFFPLFRFTGAASTVVLNLPFPEYVITHAAKTFATKEQNTELVAMLTADLEAEERRIRTHAAPLDRHEPGFMTDKRGDLDLDDDYGGWR